MDLRIQNLLKARGYIQRVIHFHVKKEYFITFIFWAPARMGKHHILVSRERLVESQKYRKYRKFRAFNVNKYSISLIVHALIPRANFLE